MLGFWLIWSAAGGRADILYLRKHDCTCDAAVKLALPNKTFFFYRGIVLDAGWQLAILP